MKLQANGAPKNGQPLQHPPHYYPELPTEVEERLEKLFRKLDVNEDGRIDINDLTAGLRKLGLPHSPGSVEVVVTAIFLFAGKAHWMQMRSGHRSRNLEFKLKLMKPCDSSSEWTRTAL